MNPATAAVSAPAGLLIRAAARPARLVAGSGRGGTTWILDALAKCNGLRPVFEPLHPQGLRDAARFAYACDGGTDMPEGCEQFFADVFNGDLHSFWSDYRVRRDRLTPRVSTLASWTLVRQFYRRWRKLLRNRAQFRPLLSAEQCIVKLIRGNLMLDWLHRTFDARIVLVVRHPGAVVESQMRLSGSDWDPHRMLLAYAGQPVFKDRYGARCADLLNRPLSRVEAHAAVWCVENQLPLESPHRHGFRVIFYEHLLESPQQQWRQMADWLALENTPDAAVRNAPSQQTSQASMGKRLDTPRDPGWVQRLAPVDSAQVQAILSNFGVSAYNMKNPMPLQPAAATMDS